ncbi:hypothetical protein DYH09_28885 [bacterium CPR1]|nr:hypothetical protein [bacterium CPR1]
MLLFTMIKTLVVITHSKSYQSRLHYQQMQAHYLCEAAVARARAELDKNPDWSEGFSEESLPGIDGTYSALFHTGPGLSVGANESVNNMRGKVVADGPRGEQTVPPHSCELIVTARVGSTERRVRVLLRKGGTILPYALSASNRIKLKGPARINGIKSRTSMTPTDAEVHSNAPRGSNVITWESTTDEEGQFTGRAEIRGKVSAVSPSGGAINFGSNPGQYRVTGGFETGSAAKPVPNYDLDAEIEEARGLPSISSSVGPGSATVTVTDSRYRNGDLSLSGDLVLEEGNLYVDGNVTINGSVTGVGSIYATGDISFTGNANIRANAPESGIAVYSGGKIQLASLDLAQFLADLEVGVTDMNTMNGKLRELRDGYDDLEVSEREALLGEVNLSATAFLAQLNTLGPSPTRDSLLKRVEYLATVTGPGNPEPAEVEEALTFGLPLPGLLLAVVGNEDYDATARHFLPGGIGPEDESSFFGLLYSKKYVYVTNHIKVMGGIWTYSDTASTPVGEEVEGVTAQNGDIFLYNGCTLTMDEEYLRSQRGPDSPGPPNVAAWEQL